MSIIITGLEMPTERERFNLTIKYNGLVFDTESGQVAEAHELPPHGDLIDREALMDDIIGSMVFSGRNVPKEAAIVQKVLDIVGDANAIIPAEEGE